MSDPKTACLSVSTLVPVASKLPNRVRWPGGGIPYSFQNIPLCPGVVHESVEKTVEKSVEKTVEKSVEKTIDVLLMLLTMQLKQLMYYLCY